MMEDEDDSKMDTAGDSVPAVKEEKKGSDRANAVTTFLASKGGLWGFGDPDKNLPADKVYKWPGESDAKFWSTKLKGRGYRCLHCLEEIVDIPWGISTSKNKQGQYVKLRGRFFDTPSCVLAYVLQQRNLDVDKIIGVLREEWFHVYHIQNAVEAAPDAWLHRQFHPDHGLSTEEFRKYIDTNERLVTLRPPFVWEDVLIPQSTERKIPVATATAVPVATTKSATSSQVVTSEQHSQMLGQYSTSRPLTDHFPLLRVDNR